MDDLSLQRATARRPEAILHPAHGTDGDGGPLGQLLLTEAERLPQFDRVRYFA